MPAFRFLHASDFHLERPPAGLAEMPDHLRDILVEAPYRAAANVFRAAIEHEVEFVVLAGDIVAPERSGPRAILFLRDQFARLAQQNIDVYWAGGFVDRVAAWPRAINWPANLHIFSGDEPRLATVIRHGRTLCGIVGQSLPPDGAIDFARFDAELSDNENGRFIIGLAHGDLDETARRSERFAYWALGGEHEPTLPQETRPLVHHPGSPQGRSRDEPGPHGCTLVEVADSGDIATMPVVTDVVRFACERLSYSPASGSPTDAGRLASDVERLLRERMQSLADANPEIPIIVDFALEGELLPYAGQLPLPTIVGVLRGEFGYRSPPIWLDRVRLPPPPPLAEGRFGQESLLGDVLRAARRRQHSGEPVDLDCYLPGGDLRGPLHNIVRVTGAAQTHAALHEAASLAVGLLSLEEVRFVKFTDLDVNGFGVWSGLKLESLSPQLTVIYGPNEAGKTTILECLRGVLYGFTPNRRDRYLPPVHGGAGGGTLAARIDRASYSIARLDDGSRRLGGVTVTGPDGSTQGQSQLDELLAGLEESAFTHTFCIGLRELQELATLNDGEAAAWLYDLSTGLEGVSISDVLGELRASRTRLLSPAGDKSQITDLLTQRETLRADIDELGTLNDRYWRLDAERDSADEAIRAAETAQAVAGAELQRIDAALAVREVWRERSLLEEKLASCGRLGDFPREALTRLERIVAGLRKLRRRRAGLKKRWNKVRAKRKEIKVNERLWRQAARIAALSEHESWIAALDEQLRAAERMVGEHEGQLAAACAQFGLPDGAVVSSGALAATAVAGFRALSKQLRAARKRLKQARDERRLLRDERGARRQEVASGLASRGQPSLPAALEKQGQLVAQYRRRLQLDMRLDQLALHRTELEHKHLRLLDRQVLPLWLLITLAVVFVFGAGLAMAGLIIPWGSAAAIIGGLTAAAAAAGKIGIERSAAHRLEATEKQLKTLARQHDQTKDERDELDSQLPAGGGAMASRLQSAEAELASLEELLSLDARRQSTDEQASAAGEQFKTAREEWNRSRRRWQQALGQSGLPPNLSPAQLKQILAHAGSLDAQERQLSQARDQRDRCRREQDAVAARIAAVLTDAGCEEVTTGAATVPLVEQLRRLRRELAAQEELIKERQGIDRRLTRLQRLAAKCNRRGRRLVGQRRAMFRAAGAIDDADFRRRTRERAELDELLHRRTALNQQIQSTLGGHSEQEIAALLGRPPEQLEQDRDDLVARRQTAADEIKRLAEQRGRLAHEQSLLADDRRLPHKQLELSAIDERLAEAASRWRTLALAEHLIESVKEQYERDRQPEVLQEASRYLERMTEGRYHRVWTPLGEKTLRVDDDQQRSLAIELLSTGAREQLFLALRLALVTRYKREGKSLPLVLDDVLVNFDAGRARAAAAMILEFAAAGHQLLLFTCHEHIAELFRSLECDVRSLPASADAEPKIVGPGVTKHAAPPEVPRRRRDRRPKEPPLPIDAANDPATAAKLETIEVLATAVAPVFVADAPVPAELSAPASPPAESPSASAVERRHRADPPQRIAPTKFEARRRRWSAEEFDGELADQVNSAFESSVLGDG